MPDNDSNAWFERIEATLDRIAQQQANNLREIENLRVNNESLHANISELFATTLAMQRDMDRRFAETDRRFAETDRRWAETDRRFAILTEAMTRFHEAMTQLAAVVRNHESRLNDLEGQQ